MTHEETKSLIDKLLVVILTHGRPDTVKTLYALRKCGYTGRIVFLIDNEDKTASKYFENFGRENVFVFDKKKEAQQTDTIDNFGNLNIVLYARNKVFDLAHRLGYEYFLVLDDDYTGFGYKFDHEHRYKETPCRTLDGVIASMLKYYIETPRILTLCMAQSGDYMGGEKSNFVNSIRTKRKAMNAFFCSTKRRFKFLGTINEDVNAYTMLGQRGELFLTTNQFFLFQTQTQKQAGGLTDIYLHSGTYVKSFYSVIAAPSGVRIAELGASHRRLHHKIRWENIAPKIIHERYRKTK